MKINLNNIDYDLDFVLPYELENNSAVNEMINNWVNLIRKQQLQEKRDLRIKKINEINSKHK